MNIFLLIGLFLLCVSLVYVAAKVAYDTVWFYLKAYKLFMDGFYILSGITFLIPSMVIALLVFLYGVLKYGVY